MKFRYTTAAMLWVMLVTSVAGVLLWRAGAWQAPEGGQAANLRQRVQQISMLAPRRGDVQPDPIAREIVNSGRAVAPALVEMLDDEAATGVAEFFVYTVADVSLALLVDIYPQSAWPSPDGSVPMARHHGDFRDYLDFVRRPGTRQRLQAAWRRYVASR